MRMTIETSDAKARRGAPIRGRHDDQLAVAIHAVQRVEAGHEHGIRRNKRHQARQAEQGHLEEEQDALTLRGD